MSGEMPPYSGPDARCPTCGQQSCWTRHRPDMHFDAPCGASGEHLDRGCRNCGYEWPEAVALRESAGGSPGAVTQNTDENGPDGHGFENGD